MFEEFLHERSSCGDWTTFSHGAPNGSAFAGWMLSGACGAHEQTKQFVSVGGAGNRHAKPVLFT